MGAWVCSVARVGGLWRGNGVCRSGSGREKEEDARVAVERCSGAPVRLSSFWQRSRLRCQPCNLAL